ncbi:MAG: hypothetical protein NZP74_16025 [Anaerolineales bacterium]|nr:hypothetical protein [Anaerolineales bacterium]MDW8278697.1 hypothetical protein [Anaerolineales bacterium]
MLRFENPFSAPASEYFAVCFCLLSGVARFRAFWLSFDWRRVGAFHYFEYRFTHDADAWWSEEAGQEQRRQVMIAANMNALPSLPALSWSDHPRRPKRPLPGTGVACGA